VLGCPRNAARQSPAVAQDAQAQHLVSHYRPAPGCRGATSQAKVADGGLASVPPRPAAGVKTPEERALLRRAVRISAVGQQEVMKAAHPGIGSGGVAPASGTASTAPSSRADPVPWGAGANGCIPHYETNKPQVGNELVPWTAGPSTATRRSSSRTILPSGKFSPAQRQIYELVPPVRPVLPPVSPGGFPGPRPGGGSAGWLPPVAPASASLPRTRRRRHFPHGTSHHLGLDVHDRRLRPLYRPVQRHHR
jgi:Xaa-Pro aminopeptidase